MCIYQTREYRCFVAGKTRIVGALWNLYGQSDRSILKHYSKSIILFANRLAFINMFIKDCFAEGSAV